MERNKEEKIRFIRDSKTRFHSLTYKMNHTEIKLDTAGREIEGWKEKEEDLHIEKANFSACKVSCNKNVTSTNFDEWLQW